jgi:hypothetical protein
MSRYTRPKRDVSNFNADNFEAEVVQSTNDVLKITAQETQSKVGFYIIPDFHFTQNPIQNFTTNNNLDAIIDRSMLFQAAGTYHIRFAMNLRPRITGNYKLLCSNSTQEIIFRIDPGIYSQVSWEAFVYYDQGDKLEFRIWDLAGNEAVIPTNDLRIMHTTLYAKQISTQNVLI